MTAAHTPWAVINSPTDPEMFAVQGAYLVADNLPIEDAHLIAAAPELLAELQALVTAVCFADPPKLFNGVECHEARVPTAFIDGARAAIAKATGGQS